MNKFLCSTLIILCASSLARAEDVYFGATLTPSDKGRISYDGDGGRQQRDGTRRNPAVGVFAGYVLSPSWALEAGYRGIGGQQAFDLDPGYQLKTRTRMAYVAVRNTWQLDEDWAVYGKVGMAQGRFRAAISGTNAPPAETARKTGLYAGVGFSYAVDKDISLQLELEHTDKLKQEGLSASMDKASLGVRFGF
jgi:OOP family OmpA-OmpF porin